MDAAKQFSPMNNRSKHLFFFVGWQNVRLENHTKQTSSSSHKRKMTNSIELCVIFEANKILMWFCFRWEKALMHSFSNQLWCEIWTKKDTKNVCRFFVVFVICLIRLNTFWNGMVTLLMITLGNRKKILTVQI